MIRSTQYFVASATAIMVMLAGELSTTALAEQADASSPASPEAMVLNKMHMANQVEMQAAQLGKDKGQAELVRKLADRLDRDHQFGDHQVQSLAGKKSITLMPVQMNPGSSQMAMKPSPPTTGPSAEQAQGPATAPASQEARIASAKMSPPSEPSAGNEVKAETKPDMKQMMVQMMQKLKQAQGAEFDSAYMMAMQKSHEQMIQTLEEAKDKLQDSDVRGLVDKMIPILKQHLALAQDVQKKLGAAQ
jgi:predicted outer membrane protein